MMNRREMLYASTAGAVGLAATPVAAQTTETPEGFTNLVVTEDGNVLVLRINTPPRNEVSRQTLQEINAGLDLASAPDVGAVVITGTGDVFSGGAGGDGGDLPPGAPTHSAVAHAVFHRIERFAKPVIAAINGLSAGGGNELAQACDIRVAGQSAVFRQHELLAGLIPGFGGMQRLSRLVGHSRATELILTGRPFDVAEAANIGYVTRIVPDDELLTAAIALAQQIAEDANGPAVAVFKERTASAADESYSGALRNDQLAFDRIAATPEAKAAIARFVEKMKAK